MSKKCLVLYSSRSGNTAKVAEKFKSTFETNGWEADIFKVDKNPDLQNIPYKIRDYDFVCIGSGVTMHLPYEDIIQVIQTEFIGPMPESGGDGGQAPQEPGYEPPPTHHKLVIGGDAKKAVVFVTYAGFEFGPREAQAALELLAIEIEHLGFKCIGKFCCPGRFLKGPNPRTYHGDIRNRPNERDLLKAELFIEDMLEEVAERPI